MVQKAEILGFREKLELSQRKLSESTSLDGRGGGPHDPGMENRVTRLEVEFEHVRSDLDEIKADLKHLVHRIDAGFQELPTKRDLSTNLQWIVGVSIAVTALFVGVLAYLQDQRIAVTGAPPSPSAPVIIQLPVTPPPTASPQTSPAPGNSPQP